MLNSIVKNLRFTRALGITLFVFLASLTLSACGSSQASSSVTSVSNGSPFPLSGITVHVGTLSGSKATVHFTSKSGLNLTQDAIRIAKPDGVVVGVPFDFNSKTGQLTSEPVSMVITQDGHSTPSYTLNIQGLPSFASKDLPLGSISHAYLVYDALLLGHRLSELQAADIKLGTNSTAAITSLQDRITRTLKARDDIDRISANPSLVLGGDKMPDGTPATFDKTSVETMDGIFEVYLLQQFGSVIHPKTATTQSLTVNGVPSQIIFASSHSGPVAELGGPVAELAELVAIKEGLEVAKTAFETGHEIQKSDNWLDYGEAVVKGGAGFLDIVRQSQVAEQLGAAFAIVDIAHGIKDSAHDLGSMYVDSVNGGDPKALAQDQANLQNDRLKTFDASVNVLSVGILKGTSNDDPNAAVHVLGLGLALSDEVSAVAGFNEDQASTSVAGHIKNPFPRNDGFSTLDGTAGISNAQGNSATLDSTVLCCFGSDSAEVGTLADPMGNYETFAPQQVTGVDYTQTKVYSVDPITGVHLAEQAVDLSGINVGAPVEIPPMTNDSGDPGNELAWPPTTTTSPPTTPTTTQPQGPAYYLHDYCPGCRAPQAGLQQGAAFGSMSLCEAEYSSLNATDPAFLSTAGNKAWCDQNSDPNETGPS